MKSILNGAAVAAAAEAAESICIDAAGGADAACNWLSESMRKFAEVTMR